MKANITNNKKNTTMRKIVPAAGMLSISAVMLATSTYAWFTMSREVEVKNIQMTATTPEDIQLSLGAITGASETVSLAKNTGYLTNSSDVVSAPTSIFDWSNTADISHYYQFGRLIPASSTNGENIYFTPDSKGVGRELKDGAKFYQAASAATAYGTGTAAAVATGGDDASAKAHVTTGSEDNWSGYTKSSAWNVTNDDGYYIDIPIWLRTSSREDQTIYVTGFVKDKTSETGDSDDTDDLYQAVRVAVLYGEADSNVSPAISAGQVDNGCIFLADNTTYPTNKLAIANTILDSDNYNTRTSGTGVNAVSGLGDSSAGAWGVIAENDGDDAIITLPKSNGNGNEFGVAKKLIIRVWLEGEDKNCWNENAGQDWDISLKFMKDKLT